MGTVKTGLAAAAIAALIALPAAVQADKPTKPNKLEYKLQYEKALKSYVQARLAKIEQKEDNGHGDPAKLTELQHKFHHELQNVKAEITKIKDKLASN